MKPRTNRPAGPLRNVVTLLALLVVPFLALVAIDRVVGAPWSVAGAGRASLALVFAFTALGHFVQTHAMAAMLPPWVPARPTVIVASGAFEAALAAALLVPAWVPWSGLIAIAFLVAVFPSNVYAAVRRVPFGGHGLGPWYLVPRGALQLVLIAWAHAFAGAA